MSKIYVPNLDSNNCVIVLDSQTLRVYDDLSQTSYTDYFVNSHYLFNRGYSSFADVECISSNDLTNDFWYRNDFDSILIIFFIISIFLVYIPFRIFSRFFGRWLQW